MGEAARRKKLGLGPRAHAPRDPAADLRKRLTLAAARLFAAVGVPPLAELAGKVLVVDHTRGAVMSLAEGGAQLCEREQTIALVDYAHVKAWAMKWLSIPARRVLYGMDDATSGVLPALELHGRSVDIGAADLRALTGAGDVPLWPELAPHAAESA